MTNEELREHENDMIAHFTNAVPNGCVCGLCEAVRAMPSQFCPCGSGDRAGHCLAQRRARGPTMTTKRGSAAESPTFYEQAKELGRICEQLRPGTGGAIEHFVRMAFDEGIASAQPRWIAALQQIKAELENIPSLQRTGMEEFVLSIAIEALPDAPEGDQS